MKNQHKKEVYKLNSQNGNRIKLKYFKRDLNASRSSLFFPTVNDYISVDRV